MNPSILHCDLLLPCGYLPLTSTESEPDMSKTPELTKIQVSFKKRKVSFKKRNLEKETYLILQDLSESVETNSPIPKVDSSPAWEEAEPQHGEDLNIVPSPHPP